MHSSASFKTGSLYISKGSPVRISKLRCISVAEDCFYFSKSPGQLTLNKGAPGDQVRAASQLPGRGPVDVDDAPALAC